ncbi:MAG TPA: phosphoserine phosphatase SerB [Sphingomonas sp.]|jgi:phosphoserine phosphatase|nr:phosphoserine phosphatase SerB [Sphingomonas sp.]
MFIVTLIAADRLEAGDISSARDKLRDAGCAPADVTELEPDRVVDIAFAANPDQARAALEGAFDCVDIVVQPAEGRRKRLIVADMDSTMITVECIDELADYAGIKPQIAEVTEAAMRGELDFAEALDARVALLKGLGADAIDRCLAERVQLMPGARTLVRTMKANGATAILVSGGFTRFAQPVGERIGFDRVIANELLIEADALTGAVTKPIVDSSTKETTLLGAMAELGLDTGATLAVGDGANDLAMIKQAGLGVAYHAKPIVAAAAGARIDHNDLTALLYAQGIPRDEWVD